MKHIIMNVSKEVMDNALENYRIMKLPDELIEKTKKWLGQKGIDFFRNIKKEYSEINAVWSEGGIPHAVHFREGMQVRNFMRQSGFCEEWNDHDFDNNWIHLIERCI